MSDPGELDALFLTVVVDNETDTLSSIDEGVDQLPEVASLLGRLPPCREHDGHPGFSIFDHLCVACHGLSVLATAHRGDEQRTVLFDVGPYAPVWLDNAERLGIDLSSIEVVFLSHWHADHSGGFPEVIAAIAAARAAAGRPAPVVDLHPDRPDQRGVELPDGTMVLLPPEPTLAEIEAAGGVVELHRDRHPVAGLLTASGRIDRVTSYETGLEGHITFVGDDRTDDPLILDERFLAAHVRGRGVTVLSACSHAGHRERLPRGQGPVPRATRGPRPRRLPPRGRGHGGPDPRHRRRSRRAGRPAHRGARPLHRLEGQGRPRPAVRPRTLRPERGRLGVPPGR